MAAESAAVTSHRSPSLTAAALRARPVAGADERVLPVSPLLVPAVPRLRRGITVSVRGSTTLALLLAAGASQAGGWTAAVGLPSLGLSAAAELGVDLTRLALVDVPADDVAAAAAVAVDGADVVLVAGGAVRPADARRLSARARERGAVVVAVDPGGVGARGGAAWPERADLRLVAGESAWVGLGEGHGHLAGRRLVVTVAGRDAGGREQTVTIPLGAAVDPGAKTGRSDALERNPVGKRPENAPERPNVPFSLQAGSRRGRRPVPPVGGDVA